MNASPLPPTAAVPGDGSDPADAATALREREWLSALADGEAAAAQPGCDAWRRDPAARAAWHEWHLIGDVMRSEDLAQAPGHDAAFLARLRERLASEPVPLAPAPLPAAPVTRFAALRRRQAWLAPAAVAAGFMVVAGALLVVQVSQTEAPTAGGALAGAPQGGGVWPVSTNGAAGPAAPVMDSQFIRDAQIDRLLEAHRGALGGAMVVPGGMKRHLDPVVPTSLPATPAAPGAALAESAESAESAQPAGLPVR
jgi:sigma-E factor negative regulatory protein RseA